MKPPARPAAALTVAIGVALAVLAPAWLMAGCGPRPTPRGGVAATDAIVRVQCNQPEAELWVDERYIGPVGALKAGVALSPGRYRLEVRHPEHHTFYGQIEVRAREQRTLDIALAKKLP